MTMPVKVWVVDDDASVRWVLEKALNQQGLDVRVFDHAEPMLRDLEQDLEGAREALTALADRALDAAS